MKLRARHVALGALLLAAGCGKKGPPLPPLVRLPAEPRDFTAERRGAAVTLRFVVPSGNTDGSTPADLTRVEVFALNGLSTLTPDEILSRGTRVGSLPVNPPRDPDATAEEQAEEEATPRDGADQGTVARLDDALTLDGVDDDTVRSYLAVGFNKRGRRGAFSARALVPMVPSPPPPPPPQVTYDEKAITIAWTPAAIDGRPSAYHVYSLGDGATRLTDQPTDAVSITDARIEWNSERCYVIRAVESANALTLQSDESAPACVTLVDTFAPAAPTGLQTVADAGAVNLIWNSNEESDLAGYLVLRAVAPSTTPEVVTASPIQDPTYRDLVPSGVRVVYAIQAVDKAGNVSPMSERREETPR